MMANHTHPPENLRLAGAVDRLAQAWEVAAVEMVHRAPASWGWCESELTPDVLDDGVGLVIAAPVLAPEACGLADDRGPAALGLRLRYTTAHCGPVRRPLPGQKSPS